MAVNPYTQSDNTRKEQVREMFNAIAPSYDFLNRFLSLGIDKLWRRRTVRMLATDKPEHILDVATGTGDLAIATSKIRPKSIVGIDIAKNMVDIGKQKVARKGLDKIISFEVGDSENLPFKDNTFDAITVAFGVRNFEDRPKGVVEMKRVLKPSGKLFILEFSQPQKFPVKQLYALYFNVITPFWGRTISKDSRAYSYLPESVYAFPDGEQFINELLGYGFTAVEQRRLTFGVATIYQATK